MKLNYNFDGEHFTHTPDDNDLIAAICYIVKEKHGEEYEKKPETKLLSYFLDEVASESLRDAIFEEFEEQLLDYFKDDAFNKKHKTIIPSRSELKRMMWEERKKDMGRK